MKKLITFLLIVSVLFSFFGCLEESDTPRKEAQNTQETEEETQGSGTKKEETFGLKETAVFDDMKITATEIKETASEGYFTAEEGKTFLGIKFTVENISDEEISVSSILLFEAYVDDIKADQSFTAAAAFSEGTLDGSVASGKKLIGWYALEIPADWKTVELDVKSDWLSDSSARFVFTK